MHLMDWLKRFTCESLCSDVLASDPAGGLVSDVTMRFICFDQLGVAWLRIRRKGPAITAEDALFGSLG